MDARVVYPETMLGWLQNEVMVDMHYNNFMAYYVTLLSYWYSDYKEHPSYQKYDGYISSTIAKYGSASSVYKHRRHSSVDRTGQYMNMVYILYYTVHVNEPLKNLKLIAYFVADFM